MAVVGVIMASGGRTPGLLGSRLGRLAAFLVVSAAHLAVFVLLLGRTQGLEVRAWTMDVTLVDAPTAIAGAAVDAGAAMAAKTDERQAVAKARDEAARTDTAGGAEEAAVAADQAGATGSAASAVAAAPAQRQGQGAGALLGESASGAADNAYQRLLQRHIRPFRLYPADAVSRRAEGVVVVRFRVARDGGVEEAWVVRRSDPALDRAALDTLWRAEPMPAVPGDLPAPVEVELAMPFRLPGR